MRTFLVTWNGTIEGWPRFEADQLASAEGQVVEMRWSFRNRSVEQGDRIFMLRQRSHRGIIATGRVTTSPFKAPHWSAEAADQRTTYVMVEWETILRLDDRLPIESLLVDVPHYHWNEVYASGQEVKSPVDAELERLWLNQLKTLGVPPEWDLEPGAIVTRTAVAQRYGGATQGGIQPSGTTPNVLIYSDPAVGRSHGYNYDGPADGAYYYTGEGQVGDQTLRAGNRVMLEHSSQGRTFRLFEAAGPTRPGGKPQRYLGAYKVDAQAPYRVEPAPDREGSIRKVIVFRLIPLGPSIDSAGQIMAQAPSTNTSVELVPTETNAVDTFLITATNTREGQRWEASLMRQLESFLSSRGHELGRIRILPAGESSSMVTDTYDCSEAELFEIKPSASRAHIRAAVAQLLDYGRHLPDMRTATVLVPMTPSEDLQKYVASAGLGLAVFTDNDLMRLPHSD